MRIFLVRHGKDDENYRGGWSNLPLTEEGKNQIKKLAEFLYTKKGLYNIQKIISSDLERAKQTTNIINEKLDVEVEYNINLREINNGKLAGMLNKEAERIYPNIYYNNLEINERYPDGESPTEFYDRIIKEFENIVKENNNYDNIMIVTHAGVINIIYRYINNLEWSNKIKSIKVSNASIFSLVINNEKRYFELENYNEYLNSK